MDLELKKKINEHYQLGQGSIQDIARVYRLDVSEVLEAIGQSELNHVDAIGDLVDRSEAGSEAVISAGKKHDAVFTTN